MFIFLPIDPTKGLGEAKNQQGKPRIEDPESFLKPMVAGLRKPKYTPPSQPYTQDQIMIFQRMWKAVGNPTLAVYYSDEQVSQAFHNLTGQESTPEREAAVKEYLAALSKAGLKDKPLQESQENELLNGILTTWSNGRFDGLPKI